MRPPHEKQDREHRDASGSLARPTHPSFGLCPREAQGQSVFGGGSASTRYDSGLILGPIGSANFPAVGLQCKCTVSNPGAKGRLDEGDKTG